MMGADNTNDATPMVTFSFGPENFSGFWQDAVKTMKAKRRTIPKTFLKMILSFVLIFIIYPLIFRKLSLKVMATIPKTLLFILHEIACLSLKSMLMSTLLNKPATLTIKQ
jgi:hypothetical protein